MTGPMETAFCCSSCHGAGVRAARKQRTLHVHRMVPCGLCAGAGMVETMLRRTGRGTCWHVVTSIDMSMSLCGRRARSDPAPLDTTTAIVCIECVATLRRLGMVETARLLTARRTGGGIGSRTGSG